MKRMRKTIVSWPIYPLFDSLFPCLCDCLTEYVGVHMCVCVCARAHVCVLSFLCLGICQPVTMVFDWGKVSRRG